MSETRRIKLLELNEDNFTKQVIKNKIKEINEEEGRRSEGYNISQDIIYLNCIKEKIKNTPITFFMLDIDETNNCTDGTRYKYSTWRTIIHEIFRNKFQDQAKGGNRNKRKRTIKKSIKKNKKSRRNMKQI